MCGGRIAPTAALRDRDRRCCRPSSAALKYFETGWPAGYMGYMGYMGQAGEKLGRTQPALTKGIRRLEAVFGGPLFERASADKALREVGDFVQGRGGRVRSGIGPITADHGR